MKNSKFVVAGATLCLGLAACSERAQVTGGKKPDQKASAGAEGGNVDPGWKVGDQASWEQQLRSRSQGQNEYARSPSTQP